MVSGLLMGMGGPDGSGGGWSVGDGWGVGALSPFGAALVTYVPSHVWEVVDPRGPHRPTSYVPPRVGT